MKIKGTNAEYAMCEFTLASDNWEASSFFLDEIVKKMSELINQKTNDGAKIAISSWKVTRCGIDTEIE